MRSRSETPDRDIPGQAPQDVGEPNSQVPIRLIVGLGNAKPDYHNTRHNVGRDFIDHLRLKFKTRTSTLGPSEFFTLESLSDDPSRPPVVAARLQSFMNTSGPALRHFLGKKEIKPSEILVVVDDMMIPFGALRLRKSGSAGGHNGLKSLIEALATMDFARLRVGIGAAPSGMDPADYVLSPFSKEEQKKLPLIWDQIEQGLKILFSDGFDAAMNMMNKLHL